MQIDKKYLVNYLLLQYDKSDRSNLFFNQTIKLNKNVYEIHSTKFFLNVSMLV